MDILKEYLNYLNEDASNYFNPKVSPMSLIIPKARRELIICYQQCNSKIKSFMGRNFVGTKGEASKCRNKCTQEFLRKKQSIKK